MKTVSAVARAIRVAVKPVVARAQQTAIVVRVNQQIQLLNWLAAAKENVCARIASALAKATLAAVKAVAAPERQTAIVVKGKPFTHSN